MTAVAHAARAAAAIALGCVALAAAGCTGSRGDAPPAKRDVDLRPERHGVSARVAAGMTVGSLLRAYHMADAEAARVIAAARSVFDLRRVRVNQPFRIDAVDGRLRVFEYEIDADRFLRIGRGSTPADVELTAEILPIPKTSQPDVLRGTITRTTPSLFAAVAAAGGGADLAIAIANIFGGEVDLNTDLQPGDTFEVLVEKQFREAHVFAGYGPVLAAGLANGGRRLRAIRFAPGGSAPSYFDEHGVSLRRFLLRSPLKFEPTVSSAFSVHRLHPILKDVRAHLGVDYRAPAGSPVVAVADGVVVEAGARGGSGQMVHLRHTNGFESEYLHLSAIVVRTHAHVHQGDLIGRVGATGLATGPHLDYRVKKNGVFVDPTRVVRGMPPADPVPAADAAAFSIARQRALTFLVRPADLGSVGGGSVAVR